MNARKVPFLDVNCAHAGIQDEIQDAVARVCESGRFLHGPEVSQLETSVAQLAGTPFAISCASGSDALLLSLMALGIGPGDDVIVPSFTFFATASAVHRVGARIRFADINRESFNIDASSVEAALTANTKAIIPVHLFGQCAEMDAICELARARRIAVVEDAAQAIGAAHTSRSAGSWGELGCFSFYPTKNLGGFGDGGMVTTHDKATADRVRLFASHGMNPRYYHSVIGINSRLDTIQAAVLNVKLTRLGAWTAERRRNAQRYRELFRSGTPDSISLPKEHPESLHVWNQFTIRVRAGSRDRLRDHLSAHQIGTEIYYPLPLHQQECFRSLGYEKGSLPETERAANEVLSLPIYPGLSAADQELVANTISSFYRTARLAA